MNVTFQGPADKTIVSLDTIPHEKQDRNCPQECAEFWWWAPAGVRHQDRHTEWRTDWM